MSGFGSGRGEAWRGGASSRGLSRLLLLLCVFLAAACSFGAEQTDDRVAVFLLATMRGSKALGVKALGGKEDDDYFERVRSARSTWAARVKHFFAVVGWDPEAEGKALASPHCKNVTSQQQQQQQHQLADGTELHRCQDVNIILARACDATAWGWRGPCCRAEAAAVFFLDNLMGGQNPHSRYFVFADDDYYVRMEKLAGLLTHPRLLALPLGPARAFALTSSRDTVRVSTSSSSSSVPATRRGADRGQTTERMYYAYAAPVYASNCTVPCTHRSTWMGFALFSSEALLLMQNELRRAGLQRVCRRWKLTHDVGLGIFVWMHGIASLPVCCGSRPYSGEPGELQSAIVLHKALPFETTHAQLEKFYASEKKPRLAEFEEGRKAFPASGILPGAGLKASIFWRALIFRDALASQAAPDAPDAAANYSHEWRADDGSNLLALPNQLSDYSPEFCTAEMEYHKAWRGKREWPLYNASHVAHPSVETLNAAMVNRVANEPAMCREYIKELQSANFSHLWAAFSRWTAERRAAHTNTSSSLGRF